MKASNFCRRPTPIEDQARRLEVVEEDDEDTEDKGRQNDWLPGVGFRKQVCLGGGKSGLSPKVLGLNRSTAGVISINAGGYGMSSPADFQDTVIHEVYPAC